jgi:4-amino-4-deoxy-L-arabinose transferase-like glycosyltransferase
MTIASSSSRRIAILLGLLVFLLLVLGFAIRMYDLTDQPIDFHSTRQLRGAVIARGMYYQMLPDADPEIRERAIAYWHSTGQYEPSILEKAVAYIYLLIGSEQIWVARIVNSLLWLIGGIAVFDLARRMVVNGTSRGVSIVVGLMALSYYLILPFGVQASRSFQPDPGMVMWIALSINILYRWSEEQDWKWAVLTGLFAGIAVLTKVVAAYVIGGAAVAMVLYSLGFRRSWRNPQVWTMLILMVAPTFIYYIGREGRAATFISSWTIALSHLLLDPTFYVRWLSLVQDIMGLTALLLSLVGVLIASPRSRSLLLGLWIGYAIYGLFLPYQMYTHNYYHLQLIPIIALSLVPVAQLIIGRLTQEAKIWQFLFAVIVLVWIAYPAWVSIAEQKQENYRNEPAYWQGIASYLPDDGKIVALTQDYGYRLMYYGWRKVRLWPTRGERTLSSLRGSEKEFEEYFEKRIGGRKYFLITSFNQFNSQPDLREMLRDNYPIYAEGSGYLIFDLDNPLNEQ